MLIRGEANNSSVELSEAQWLSKPIGSESYRVTLRENEFEKSHRVIETFRYSNPGRERQGYDRETR